MINKTEAIVLRTVDFQESSLIATLFTKNHGKVTVIAKGARRPKSKFAALLVPGQVLEVIYYYKSSRSVQTLSDGSYSRKLHNLRVDLEKMALATTTLELVSQLVHDNEGNGDVYDFLINFLTWINDAAEVARIIFPYVQIRLTQLTGIGLQVESVPGEESVNGYLNIQAGSVSVEPAGDDAVQLTKQQFDFVIQSLHSMNSGVFEIKLSKNELNGLIETLDRYYRYHVDGIKPRRSDRIFEQLLNDGYEQTR